MNAAARHAPDEPAAGPARWFRSRERMATVASVLLLGGLLLAFYYRLWLPGLVLIKRDAFRFFAPIKQYIAERLLAGELPEWFPYESLGRSVIGSPSTGVFHPFTLLFLMVPSHDALRLATLLTCLMGGLGAFALGRVLRISRAGSLVAGAGFACSGFVVSMTEHITYLYGICALPLFCAALSKAYASRTAWIVAPAVIWATVFLNGDIQTGYYYGYIALLWAATCSPLPFNAAVLRTACAGILAGLLAAVQLAPSLVAFLASERSDPGLFREAALLWSLHPLRAFTVLASPVTNDMNQVDAAHFMFGGLSTGRSLVGFLADSVYLGAPLLGLAWLGARSRRDLRGLVWLGLAALWLALGRYGGLYEVFYHVAPLWSAFRYPEKFMGIVSFAVAMLAGAGVDALRRGEGRPAVWLALAVACAGAWGVVQTDTLGNWMAAFLGAPIALVRDVLQASAESALFACLAAAGAGAVVAALHRRRLSETVLLGILLVLVMLDLSRANQGAYHTGPGDAARFTPGLVEAIRKHAGPPEAGRFRIFSETIDYATYPALVAQSVTPAGGTSVVLKQALHAEMNAAFGIESINVYMPGQSAELTRLRDLVARDFWVRAYARYNVAYFIGPQKHFAEPPFSPAVVATLPAYDLALAQNPVPPHPRAYLSRNPQPVASRVDLNFLMKRPDFLAGASDFIEAPGGAGMEPDRGGRATIERYRPEEVRVRVETEAPAVLILLDACEEGWRAALETGDGLPIRCANALVRAVAVPAGTHLVTFTYRTPLLFAGAGLSLAGAVLCLILVGASMRRERTVA